ncbi:DEAD (Asp-Glu-Ala-Asp) box polypeptide 52 [Coelomomyces lativittatus]|nr:DEAD (Asp-Glu-Ala-Asp) box polypeptide 52 [Coelomomyces lativittatus]
MVVLDECDKLLEKPGNENVLTILKACPEKRLIGMLSATLPRDIELFAKSILRPDFVRVLVGHKNTVATNIQQSLLFVGDEPGKRTTLRQQLVSGELKAPILIFVQNMARARTLYEEFSDLPIEYIHAERSDHQREKILQSFRSGQKFILIGTDLVARGMDLVVNTVINFDFPTSTEIYIHRLGRTGRAGRPGKAITYFTVEDGKYLRFVANIMKESGCQVPDWLLNLKAPSQKERKLLKYAPPKRKKFYSNPISKE